MKPAWLTKRFLGRAVQETENQLKKGCLHTVCQEAKCPNLCECFARKTATFLLLGKSCTRACPFCEIDHSCAPNSPMPEEPHRIVESVRELGLRHVVLTMVTRDDLSDGGASHLAATAWLLKHEFPDVTVEVLTSDFEGKRCAIKVVVHSGIDVFNHNIETVERLTPKVRHKATYRRSLEVLQLAHEMNPSLKTKSGLMVGLGEKRAEVEQSLRDLVQANVSLVTIGQYLQPSNKKLPVVEYVHPDQFYAYQQFGESIGLERVLSGPFVRSSYHADALL